MTVTMTLETMKFHAYHGVKPEERIIGGTYLVDVTYLIDTVAVASDRITDTIDYAVIFNIVKAEMAIPSNTIEHVAGRTLKAIKAQFPQMPQLTVKITKCFPPVSGEMAAASAFIESSKKK